MYQIDRYMYANRASIFYYVHARFISCYNQLLFQQLFGERTVSWESHVTTLNGTCILDHLISKVDNKQHEYITLNTLDSSYSPIYYFSCNYLSPIN